MQIQHIALNINDISEINHFYKNILKCWPENNFEIEEQMALKIFGIKEKPKVFTMRNSDVSMELFLSNKELPKPQGYQYICIKLKDRKHTAEKAKAYGYEVVEIKRNTSDLLFIKDKAGNTFELKEL